jgi:hypothetical protein
MFFNHRGNDGQFDLKAAESQALLGETPNILVERS